MPEFIRPEIPPQELCLRPPDLSPIALSLALEPEECAWLDLETDRVPATPVA
ncbi:hypothetical protein [Histidinibacterium lentulum]|uniref:hypothetical protein n=1 Tax=Histidinibacterium lentulum TaxID=2480588 RepID=UPI00160D68F7|nr:hypothetical protein [Histidinibacterium lentulum]